MRFDLVNRFIVLLLCSLVFVECEHPTNESRVPIPQRVAYLSNEGQLPGVFDLYVKNINDGSVVRLTTTPEPEYNPQFFPDGTKLLYGVAASDYLTGQVYSVNIDGSGMVLVADSCKVDPQRRISGDGTKIAYLQAIGSGWNSSGTPWVALINSDGSSKRIISVGPAECPTFSRDGSIVCYRTATPEPGTEKIMLYRIGSGQTDSITIPGLLSEILFPQISPRGDKIAFIASLGFENHSLYLIDSNGANLSRLTPPINPVDVRYSPDDSSILYVKWDGLKEHLYSVSKYGGQPRLLSDTTFFDSTPEYSVNGSQIIFASDTAQYRISDIVIIDSDGTHRRKITNSPWEEKEPCTSPR